MDKVYKVVRYIIIANGTVQLIATCLIGLAWNFALPDIIGDLAAYSFVATLPLAWIITILLLVLPFIKKSPHKPSPYYLFAGIAEMLLTLVLAFNIKQC